MIRRPAQRPYGQQSLGGPFGPSGGRGGGGTRRFLGRHRRAALVLAACLVASLGLALFLTWQAPDDKTRQDVETHIEAHPSPTFCSRTRPPLVCAHGGDTRSLPANTREAFQAALDMRADCMEVDVALSQDKQLVVMHVRELEQLLGNKYRPGLQVGDFPWSQLQALTWPGGQRPMLVREAIQMTSPHVECVTLDVKTYQDSNGQPVDEGELVDAVTRLIHDTQCANCLVWAKSDKIVHAINLVSPGQRTGFILMNQTVEARELGMADASRMQAPEVVGVYYGMVDAELVRTLHARRKQVFAWTVNDPHAMRQMLDHGVDALVTNKAELLQQAIEFRLSRC